MLAALLTTFRNYYPERTLEEKRAGYIGLLWVVGYFVLYALLAWLA
jgi:hypothetical protein